MSVFKFSKPKTPGFGLSAEYYLTVLTTINVMPPLVALINPKGDGGATVGFGAPLRKDATKDEITAPIDRGAYALVTKDKKTVIKMLVLTAAEAGFDPLGFVKSPLALGVEPELVERVKATRCLCQLKYESHDPMVYPALDFLLGLCVRLSTITNGVIADPLAERYLLPHRALHPNRQDERVDARDHVSVAFRTEVTGLHAYTRGLRKFLLPELEIQELRDGDEAFAARALLGISQRCLLGSLVQTGDRFGSRAQSLYAQPGGLDPRLWDGIEAMELRPPVGSDTSAIVRELAGTF